MQERGQWQQLGGNCRLSAEQEGVSELIEVVPSTFVYVCVGCSCPKHQHADSCDRIEGRATHKASTPTIVGAGASEHARLSMASSVITANIEKAVEMGSKLTSSFISHLSQDTTGKNVECS
jgi:hypothetical protein